MNAALHYFAQNVFQPGDTLLFSHCTILGHHLAKGKGKTIMASISNIKTTTSFRCQQEPRLSEAIAIKHLAQGHKHHDYYTMSNIPLKSCRGVKDCPASVLPMPFAEDQEALFDAVVVVTVVSDIF